MNSDAQTSTSQTSARLFHLMDRSIFECWGEGLYQPSGYAAEGFIHFSFANQIRGTLGLHFAHTKSIVLVEVDPLRCGEALKLEESRGGALFPHLYREMQREDIIRFWVLENLNGTWTVPSLGEKPENDSPTGDLAS